MLREHGGVTQGGKGVTPRIRVRHKAVEATGAVHGGVTQGGKGVTPRIRVRHKAVEATGAVHGGQFLRHWAKVGGVAYVPTLHVDG